MGEGGRIFSLFYLGNAKMKGGDKMGKLGIGMCILVVGLIGMFLILVSVYVDMGKIGMINTDKNVTWYTYTYRAPFDEENGERARMAVIPYLRELGWDGGITVAYPGDRSNSYLIIDLPFELEAESLNTINETLADFQFEPMNIKQEVGKIKNEK